MVGRFVAAIGAAIGAAGLLAGCSGGAPGVETAAHACRLERVADLPMAPGTPFAVIPARLDGQAASMLLDTGDERLTVTRQAQLALRLPEDRRHSTRVFGVGGSVTNFDVLIQRFEIGEAELAQSGAAVAGIPNLPQVDPMLAGIIGGQVLSDYDVEFDFRGRRVGFWQRSGCDRVAPAWTGAWSSALLSRGTGNLMTLSVLIDGKSVRALLDTGARNTMLGFAAASRLGITASELAAGRTLVNRGADENDVITHVHRLHEIAVDDIKVANFPVLVGPVHIPFADVLLGLDFLRGRDLWLSYGGQRVFIR